jgi:hypothetical protein
MSVTRAPLVPLAAPLGLLPSLAGGVPPPQADHARASTRVATERRHDSPTVASQGREFQRPGTLGRKGCSCAAVVRAPAAEL